MRAPNPSEFCNVSIYTPEEAMEAEQAHATHLVLLGAVTSLAAGIIGFVSARRATWDPLALNLLGVLGAMGAVLGLIVAFLLNFTVC